MWARRLPGYRSPSSPEGPVSRQRVGWGRHPTTCRRNLVYPDPVRSSDFPKDRGPGPVSGSPWTDQTGLHLCPDLDLGGPPLPLSSGSTFVATHPLGILSERGEGRGTVGLTGSRPRSGNSSRGGSCLSDGGRVWVKAPPTCSGWRVTTLPVFVEGHTLRAPGTWSTCTWVLRNTTTLNP